MAPRSQGPTRRGGAIVIRVERLSKCYGTVRVLNEISAEISRGEVIAVIGPSGAGKSTFLRCLNLLERPTSGAIWVDGQDLLDRRTNVSAIRQKMNMVFQSFNLFAHLSALDNLTLGPVKLRGVSRQAAEDKALELLRLVGLGEKAHSFPDELSGGQQQRVAIARCLAMEPEIILFDEPTSALDPTTVSEVLQVIRRLARDGMTMAIVTHEMDFARDVASRVFYMDEGTIYEEGPPDRIFGRPEREKTRAFIQRIRSFTQRIASPDYDLYALYAELDAFCDKHILPRDVRESLQLVVEEMLQLYRAAIARAPLELTIGYAERSQELELTWAAEGWATNPLEDGALPDDLGVHIVRGLTEAVTCERTAAGSRLTMRLRKQPAKER
jgi:polar amino acid transport system ATP-binding protein